MPPVSRIASGLLVYVLLALSAHMVSAQEVVQATPGSDASQGQAASGGTAIALAGRELVVGTKQVPPFAMKDDKGTWTGISIDLWNRIAAELGTKTRFVEEPLNDLLVDTAAGKLDASIAAITVTAEREQTLDFTQPYFTTGLGIATRERGNGIWNVVRGVFSLGFVQAVLGLALLLFIVGALLWLFERRRNDQFGGGPAKGLGSAFWWSAVTMTTVGYGDKAPTTLPGRLVAIGWMFASVIIISSITAGITAALTTAQLQGSVTGPNDLPSVAVGSVEGSSSASYLSGQRIGFSHFGSLGEGLNAVESGRLDAFVYDRPLLQYAVQQRGEEHLTVLPAEFDRQGYAVALPNGSSLREPVDRALLSLIHADWWSETRYKYLGAE